MEGQQNGTGWDKKGKHGKKSAEKDRKEQKRTPDRIGIRVGGNKLCQERT